MLRVSTLPLFRNRLFRGYLPPKSLVRDSSNTFFPIFLPPLFCFFLFWTVLYGSYREKNFVVDLPFSLGETVYVPTGHFFCRLCRLSAQFRISPPPSLQRHYVLSNNGTRFSSDPYLDNCRRTPELFIFFSQTPVPAVLTTLRLWLLFDPPLRFASQSAN